MFISLELPGGDKHVTLFALNLEGDEGFDQCRPSVTAWYADRSRVGMAVNAANRALAGDQHKLISTIFNQFAWEGTSGWEYWSHDFDKVLKHALVVAAALEVPLHVHKSFDAHLLDAAEKAGIKLDFVGAKRVAQKDVKVREFEYTNRRLDRGEYIELVNVVLPEGTPTVDIDW
ncbi:MAG: hypothetical protein IT343_14600 [Candidatus Melainabacteria bacterium]|jgi:hypothetical protein|nr:hypothetical protein [Candidatus Melainabacteria bacterium]